MTKSQKIISIIVSALAAASIATTIIILIATQKQPEPIVEEPPRLDCPMADGVVSYGGETGKTALELLASICEIETDLATDGTTTTVSAIDDIATITPDYWAFYVNGTYALVGPADYQTTETEIIKWQLETLGN